MQPHARTLRPLGAISVAMLLTASIFAQSAQEWRPDDVLLRESGGSMEISPDGQWVVWVKEAMDKEKGSRVSNLVLSSLADTVEIPLTRGKDSHSGPAWSPDGRLIAFSSTRDLPEKREDVASAQIWLINPRGGEAWPVSALGEAPKEIGWRDPGTVIYAASEDPSLYTLDVKKRKDTSRVIEDAAHEAPVRLFSLDVKTGKSQRITQNDDWISGFEISPDGRWAVTTHSRSLSYVFDHKVMPVLRLVDLATGESTDIEPDTRLSPGSVTWALDNSGFYYTYAVSSHPFYFTATVTRLRYFDLSTRTSLEVDLASDWGLGGYGGGVQATRDGFIAFLAQGVRNRPAHYVKQAGRWTLRPIAATHAGNIWNWEVAKDGSTLVYNHSTASEPDQWYTAQLNGSSLQSERRLTRLNPSYGRKPKPRSEVIHWEGAEGDQVEGLLFYPLNYEEGRRYPLMLSIHGGPSGTDSDSWSQSYSAPVVLLCQRGAFVLKANYHGSGNYGLAWVESIGNGRYYDLERVDLINGVDHLIDRGLVDPDRVGSMGWSNGAILTTELVTRFPDRFKVASAGAGDVEWISDWGNVNFGASFDNYYFGMPPYEDPAFYIEKSPYFRLPNVKTPTILFTGTDDVNVPPSQSWSHYRVLQQATDTPVRFVTFPGEPHGLRKYVHQKRKLDEDLAWIDRYLFGKAPESESLRRGSPLDQALKVRAAARVNGLYGTQVKDKLVPEVAQHKEVLLGRFEVTRAQYAAFDTTYAYPHGTQNFPASGLDSEQAQAYANWLSELTGETWRLPTPEELGTTAGSSGTQNTLDYWAGYAPNPEDVTELRKEAARLEGDAPLLREVGTFAAGADETVFDLGGNVAEWTRSKSGAFVLQGGSADSPGQAKSNANPAGEAYRGVRVVKAPTPR